MPSRAARMGKRLSQAPRFSVVMVDDNEPGERHGPAFPQANVRMPSYSARMSKRLSQAPRLSLVMAGGEMEASDHKPGSVRDFCTEHIKTIVTVVMIFGTILCIVLIVMVHKWKYESHEAQEINACLDVAVIGAGLSGTYTAWRLRHTPLKVQVFEATDRAGGRVHTHRFEPEYPDLRAELGALYYLPQSHPLLNRTIHALGLQPRSYRRPSPDQPSYYLRGRHLTRSDLESNRGPYTLRHTERYNTPRQHKRFYDLHQTEDPLEAKMDGVNLYDMGYWNLLGRIASREGFNYLRDSVPWRTFTRNGNAALMSDLDPGEFDKEYTLDGGMDTLPNAMIDQFENSSFIHEVHYNSRLGCIQKRGRLYHLFLTQTTTTDETTTDKYENVKVCARNVVFAIPPDAVKKIKMLDIPPQEIDDLQALLTDSLESIPAVSMYFLYNKTFWSDHRGPEYPDVITDLPVRQMRYVGSQMNALQSHYGEYGHLMMVANVNGRDADYFTLLENAAYDGFLNAQCNYSMQVVRDVHRQLDKIQRIHNISAIPAPIRIAVKDWRKTPSGAGWHMWKRGVRWDRTASRMRKPLPRQRFYLTGSSYCPGKCQMWMEGALQTAEAMVQKYFLKHELKTNGDLFEYGSGSRHA